MVSECHSLTAEGNRPIILCLIGFYLPGYRAGGPVRSIANFVEHLGDEFDIRVVTRDCDLLSCSPFNEVTIDGWNRVGKANVFYASKKTLTLFGISRILRETPHDILYLNSFFEFQFATLPLLARKLCIAPKKSCVIAPRGEFSPGALALKTQKKFLYLKFVKFFNLFTNLTWQASSCFECADIQRMMATIANDIKVASDLPTVGVIKRHQAHLRCTQGDKSQLHIVFLSRICRMKNLSFLLKALHYSNKNIHLNIYGPLEDSDYWVQCQSLIATLPVNITVKNLGVVDPSRVLDVFSVHDLFVLPTCGENYGHVVLESLIAGTPVLISDKTPWQATSDDVVQVLPLADPFRWASALDRWAMIGLDQRLKLRVSASNYSRQHIESSTVIEKNRSIFLKALHSS
jgi:glycosyltransferase involved in cell wall biosynthesis